MLAKRRDSLPPGDDWLFEPKWDGFRVLAFRDGDQIALQSKAGQPLTRYFPEVVAGLAALKPRQFILDGEIVIPIKGRLSFDDLLLRIHPAESRIQMLARESPAQVFVFDLLYEPGRLLVDEPLRKRRSRLEKFFDAHVGTGTPFRLSPCTDDRKMALDWFRNFGAAGLDGVMAKRPGEPYHSGDREAMVKVKHLKTAECVVGGYRYSSSGDGLVGTLLLGLYDEDRNLVFIGHTASFNAKERRQLRDALEPLRGPNAFSVRVPGGPSRWANDRSGDWEPVKPALVCEVQYDYYSQGRFRHGSKFLRWRPEKLPRECTIDQVEPARRKGSLKALGLG